MAPVTRDPVERRREPRRRGGGARYQERAVLRPGQPVVLININSRAALVESDSRLRPGAHTEMQLACGTTRASIRGHLDRCYVAALEPLRYRGVMMFDQCIDLEDTAAE